MKVELIRSEGCGHAADAERLLREVLGAVAPSATLSVTTVSTEEQAIAARFAGSPTILVDGVDLEPDAVPISGFG